MNIETDIVEHKIAKSNRFVGFLLSLTEWYDFAVFASLVNILGSIFFHNTDSWMSLLYGFMSLAIGFFFRPLGASLFGYLADKHGSTYTLKYSILFMTIGTLGIGLLPLSYPTFAIFGLIICRILQGIALGGCYGISYVHVIQNTGQGRKNRSVAFVCMGFLFGFIFGNAFVGILSYVLNEQMQTFGWRIPFIVGGLNSLALFFYLRSIPIKQTSGKKVETIHTKHVAKKWTISNMKKLLKSITLISLDMIGFHIFFIFNVSYLIQIGGNQGELNIQTAILMIALIPLIWMASFIADKTNEKATLIFASISFTVLGILFPWIHMHELALGLLMLGATYGALPNLIVSQFDGENVSYFTGLAFNIASAIFGGLMPMIATILVQKSIFSLQLTLGCIGLIILVILLSSKQSSISNNSN